VDKSMKREPGPLAMSPYGSFEAVLSTLTAQLEAGPYMLGQEFSAADVLWGTALQWTTAFGLVPVTPVIKAYLDRTGARPAALRVKEKDAALVAERKPS
jgi:glutathione S-transferase